jgi:hypothetical protein
MMTRRGPTEVWSLKLINVYNSEAQTSFLYSWGSFFDIKRTKKPDIS